jgi:DNA replication protein DnaC
MTPVCQQCNGTGWVTILNEHEVECVRRCPCWLAKQRRWAEDVPQEFQAARLSNYKALPGNREAMKAARAFLAGARDLVLVGGVGAGKTRLACSILNEAFDAGRFGWFLRVPLMLKSLQPCGDDNDERSRLMKFEHRLMVEPMMCLDDLGAERERATDFTRRTLLQVYEQRHDRGARTIWTSNKTIDEIAAMQDDDRLASRLAGWADVVVMSCEDQRLAG